jgi:uncharacterized protein involved in exopolysaccharide biosynthesis
MQQQFQQPVICEEDEIDLRELFKTIWRYKFFIAIFVFFVTSITVAYTLAKPNEYKVYVKLSSLETQKSLNLGGLGALASMAGISVGSGGGVTPDVAFEMVLSDYAFMKKFIEKRGVQRRLFDENLSNDYIFAFGIRDVYDFFNKASPKKAAKKPTAFDIYKQLKNSFSISKDKKTSIIEISFTHPSRKLAYYILNSFLEDATEFLVAKNLKELNSQIKKYQLELQKTKNLELKAELAKLISSLIKQKVFINTSKYYKVKVITEPYLPDKKDKIKPKRALIVVVSFVTSLILSIFLVFFIEFIRAEEKEQ